MQSGAHPNGGEAVRLQPPKPPKNQNLKNTGFVDTVISKLCNLPY